ncbi:MAG: hypothetical protein ACFFB2_13940 [Promethearchaeota archaeon]
MVQSKKKLEVIADQLNLTLSDLEIISQSKKKKRIQYITVAIFESILGVLSFIIGYMSIPPESEVIGYPFFTSLIMGGNFSINTQIKKKIPLILVGFISLFILLIGLYSGRIFGIAMKTTIINQYGSYRYGVYSNKIYGS